MHTEPDPARTRPMPNFWRGLSLNGIEQTSLVNTFKGYDQAEGPLKGEGLL